VNPFLVAGAWAIAAVAMVGVKRRWRTSDEDFPPPPRWPGNAVSWRGYRRAMVPAALAFLLFALAATVSSLLVPLFLGAYLALLLAGTTFLFSWPRLLIPPPLREQPSVLWEVLAKRRGRGLLG
jgi:hypothetical protein